jgi:hypothetical protein
VQLYMSGADALTHGHRHADAFNVQLYAGPWEVFPDVGYIWDHPGKKWAAATASHQTVVVDGKNSVPAAASRLLGFCGEGRSRFVDMAVELEGGIALRRALTLLRLDDGMPLLIDLFEVEGGRQHDYQMRAQLPSDPIRVAAAQRLLPETFEAQVSMQHYEKPARPPQLQISGIELTPRKKALYQEHSYYPLRDLRSGGQLHGGWTAVWRKGRRQVRAHVLTPCSELVAYRSALAIADGPDNYHDTAVLRSRKKRSRFAVVYEVVEGRRQVRAVEYREVATGIEVVVRLMAGRQIEIAVPAVMTAASEKNWHVRWRSK